MTPGGQPRCPDCGAFLAPIGDHDHTCANARCPSSWQAAKRDFESSMLGAAIRGTACTECYTAKLTPTSEAAA